MKLTVLGCWGGFSYRDSGTTAFLLESDDFHLLIDCGSGALVSLEHYVDPRALDAVILSHYHHDHIADLGVLQYYRQLFPTEQKIPILKIYGHQEDAQHFTDLSLPEVSVGVAYDPKKELTIGPFSIKFLKTVHPVVCYALKITEVATGKVFTFTGDTGYFPELADFVKGSELLLADTYLFKGHEKHHAHLTSVEAGEISKVAGVSKLVLTHLPQVGDLTQLQQEAQTAAGSETLVVLAQKDLQIII
ncbi:MBL fold metallo-hydrolase [Enterococcus timonensis]|uniref:MBL fold metallo-hydrolase n=1 Tax=Enterococcus timonensis TaxID=1852364 RepID=UPI0008DA9971|nr:MBL fold metallo-hydrolase [Enterococcus timonensis]